MSPLSDKPATRDVDSEISTRNQHSINFKCLINKKNTGVKLVLVFFFYLV